MKINKVFAIAFFVKCCIIMAVVVSINSCKKEKDRLPLHYYEVGTDSNSPDWRDSSFIVATRNPDLVTAIQAQLNLPVVQRKIVSGELASGSGGYNKNAAHEFKWHFKENGWHLTDLSMEISDGRPYSDVDVDISYWLNTVKRFSPWSSYIKREIFLIE